MTNYWSCILDCLDRTSRVCSQNGKVLKWVHYSRLALLTFYIEWWNRLYTCLCPWAACELPGWQSDLAQRYTLMHLLRTSEFGNVISVDGRFSTNDSHSVWGTKIQPQAPSPASSASLTLRLLFFSVNIPNTESICAECKIGEDLPQLWDDDLGF